LHSNALVKSDIDYVVLRDWTFLLFALYYPAPDNIGDGVLFSIDFFLYFFVSLFFVSLSARLRENGWTDLHEIFREGVE